MIDFDYNATTPIKSSVRTAMQPYLNGRYGNPSSIHQIGQAPKAAVEEARESIAQSVNADAESLVLTGSGSEANTLAIRGYLDYPLESNTILSTPVEHSSVKDTLEWLEDQGATVKRIPMKENGQPGLSRFKSMLSPAVDLVSVMSVNNETGVIFPIEEIGELCSQAGVIFHTDAIQAYGKRSLDFSKLPVDMMTISSHKVGGPKGAGALFAPKSINLDPLIFGGHQERDRRGGTENVPGVVGFGKAAQDLDPEAFREVESLRNTFENYLQKELDTPLIVGQETQRVANTSGLVFKDVKGEDVVMKMDMKGYGIATGAACTSGSSQPSHVLKSIPLPEGYQADGFVRFSFSPEHSESTILSGAQALVDVVSELRSNDVEPRKAVGQV